jgi:hypothetical protein
VFVSFPPFSYLEIELLGRSWPLSNTVWLLVLQVQLLSCWLSLYVKPLIPVVLPCMPGWEKLGTY